MKIKFVLAWRNNHNSEHYEAWIPSLNLKLNPLPKLSWRIANGSGFRFANSVTEKHDGIAGVVHFESSTELKPEKSRNVNTSLTLNVPGAVHALKFKIIVQQTSLDNFIVRVFENRSGIIYVSSVNVAVDACAKGIDLICQYFNYKEFDLSVVYELPDSEINRKGDELFWAPKYKISVGCMYTLPEYGASISLGGGFYIKASFIITLILQNYLKKVRVHLITLF
jgi:hypothetical protein